jgi:hypothetical protein
VREIDIKPGGLAFKANVWSRRVCNIGCVVGTLHAHAHACGATSSRKKMRSIKIITDSGAE